MRLPSKERYTIFSTMSQIEAKKVLNAKAEEGWKLVGFTTREGELVMVFERMNIVYRCLSGKHTEKEKKAVNRRRKWIVGLKWLFRGRAKV